MSAAPPPFTASPQGLALGHRLDLSAATPLAAELQARHGQSLEIDASGVQHLGGLCLQVLLAAAASWRAAGQSLVIAPRSPAFDEALATFGLEAAALESRGMLEHAA